MEHVLSSAPQVCPRHHCMNGGTCIEKGGSIFCRCPVGKLGDICQTGRRLSIVLSLDARRYVVMRIAYVSCMATDKCNLI